MVAITRQTLSRPLLGPASYLASRGKLPLSTRTGHAAHSSLAAFEQLIADYLPLEQVKLVRRAYYYSEQAHYGQTRRSGEPMSHTRSQWPAFWRVCIWTRRA